MVKISNCGHDENGRYAGGKAGDQTGTEYQIMNWYSRPWMCVLRFENRKTASLIADMAKKAALEKLSAASSKLASELSGLLDDVADAAKYILAAFKSQ